MIFRSLLVLTCLGSSAAFASTPAVEDYNFAGWTVSVQPRAVAKTVVADKVAQPTKTTTTRVIRIVRETREVRYVPAFGGRYYYGLPRIGSNFSVYFPWRNYRGYYGYSSQYRPRTIYNYGW